MFLSIGDRSDDVLERVCRCRVDVLVEVRFAPRSGLGVGTLKAEIPDEQLNMARVWFVDQPVLLYVDKAV